MMRDVRGCLFAIAMAGLLLGGLGCAGATSGADDATDAFMERVTAGDEVGARAYWAWDYPLGSGDQNTLYSRLVRDLSEGRERVSFERHSVFYYRDAAFSQPVKRARDAQVSQVDITMTVDAADGTQARERLTLILARSPGTPEEWRIFAVRTHPEVVERFAEAVVIALDAQS